MYDSYSLEGDEILADRMPGTVVQEKVDLLAEPLEHIEKGLTDLVSRLQEAVDFVENAEKHGICRCVYAKDPECVVCRAKDLLNKWEMQYGGPSEENTPAFPYLS